MNTAIARILTRDRAAVSQPELEHPAHRDCITCNPPSPAQKVFARKAIKARTSSHVYCPACTKRTFDANANSQELAEPSRPPRPHTEYPALTRHPILLRNDFDAMFDHPRSSFRELNPPRLYSAFAPTHRSASGSTVCLNERVQA
ncbi:uncharacterized protein LOC62_04G006446 [Vanrija pseudolonga]|uniref:Uncharacterized protein n=1 Tax=Vanrija pseudolonga TaxID=143232 RepID=A0AAF0YBK4_9TREE|nr:hypothetical protein LOC62_04G006446 [Vanrija pseudolonga]